MSQTETWAARALEWSGRQAGPAASNAQAGVQARPTASDEAQAPRAPPASTPGKLHLCRALLEKNCQLGEACPNAHSVWQLNCEPGGTLMRLDELGEGGMVCNQQLLGEYVNLASNNGEQFPPQYIALLDCPSCPVP